MNSQLQKANAGDVDAMFDVGLSYLDGAGLEKDTKAGEAWLHKGVAGGSVACMTVLGEKYLNGTDLPKDEIQGMKLIHKAAAMGGPRAQYKMGLICAQGEGFVKDEAASQAWFRKAADGGYMKAQTHLGRAALEANKNGDALKWLGKAARQGDAEGQYFFGIMHLQGIGVTKNEVEAYKWFLLSAAQGDELARAAYPVLEKDFSPEMRVEGQRLAREFKIQKD